MKRTACKLLIHLTGATALGVTSGILAHLLYAPAEGAAELVAQFSAQAAATVAYIWGVAQ